MSDTAFIVGVIVFISVIVFFGVSVPQAQVISGFDFAVFAASIIGISTACVIATGLPCAAALLFFSFLSFIVVENPILSALVFTPITFGVAFVLSKLARGN